MFLIICPIFTRFFFLIWIVATCECRDDLEAYSGELKNHAVQIVDLMAKALAVDTMEIRELFGEGVQSMRINYYPPCPQPELTYGLPGHTDPNALTILLQDLHVAGLQVLKDGKWLAVNPIPDAFVINIGDQLQVCNKLLIYDKYMQH